MEFDTRQTRADIATTAAKRGDFATATNVVLDLVAEDWNNAEGHLAWGRVLRAQGKAVDAVAAFRTALVLNPTSADIHFELASGLLEEAAKNPYLPLTNWIEAREAVTQGLRLRSDSLVGRHLLRVIDEQRDRALP